MEATGSGHPVVDMSTAGGPASGVKRRLRQEGRDPDSDDSDEDRGKKKKSSKSKSKKRKREKGSHSGKKEKKVLSPIRDDCILFLLAV